MGTGGDAHSAFTNDFLGGQFLAIEVFGGAFGGAAFGTGGGRGIRAQFHFAVKQRSCAFRVHDQEYKVGGLAAQLESDTDAFERVQGWGSPLALVVLAAAADHHATSVAAADAKCALFHGGQNDKAFGLVEQILRDVVGDVQDFFHDDAGILDTI